MAPPVVKKPAASTRRADVVTLPDGTTVRWRDGDRERERRKDKEQSILSERRQAGGATSFANASFSELASLCRVFIRIS